MSQSNIHQYVGLDVSLKETSICVVDEAGKIVWRGRTDSTPEAIAGAIKRHARHVVRIGLESGQLSTWLFHGLKGRGLPAICIDARHAKAALSLKVNKTDANDALGLAQIMRVGWYREVAVKGVDGQALRALVVARAQLVSQITTLKNTVRGILKTFGLVLRTGLRSQFPKQVREAIHDNPVLAPIVEPTLRVLEATRDIPVPKRSSATTLKKRSKAKRATRIQYGALPYRLDDDASVKVLLVTSRETKRWIIPKGWPIKGLEPSKAAAREAYEEAGVRCRIGGRAFGHYVYEKRLGIGALRFHVRSRSFHCWSNDSQRTGRSRSNEPPDGSQPPKRLRSSITTSCTT
jgi:ADP-ribose pyrophosphatase YjhB (NUDIX family)